MTFIASSLPWIGPRTSTSPGTILITYLTDVVMIRIHVYGTLRHTHAFIGILVVSTLTQATISSLQRYQVAARIIELFQN